MIDKISMVPQNIFLWSFFLHEGTLKIALPRLEIDDKLEFLIKDSAWDILCNTLLEALNYQSNFTVVNTPRGAAGWK